MVAKNKLAPNLIHCYRRKNGEPLTCDGWIYPYKDSDHSTPKAIYQDSTFSNPYPIPIPITANGTLPLMYWTDDEQYYVEIYDGKKDEGGELIDSFVHFPDVDEDPDNYGQDLRNYFDNPEFRKFQKSSYETDDLPENENTYVADEGWFYFRNTENTSNSIKIKEFTPGQTIVPDNPKYYLEFECSAIGAGGENRSDLLLKIDDVSLFSGENISFSVWGESPTSSVIEFIVYQFFGTNGDAPNPKSTLINLNNSYEQHILNGVLIDSVNGKNITYDNYLAIGIRFPINEISIERVTKFQINRGSEILQYDLLSINQENMKKRAYELPDCTDDDLFSYPEWQGLNYDPQKLVGSCLIGFEKSRRGFQLCDGSSLKTLDSVPDTDDRLTYRRLWDWWEDNLDSPPGGISLGDGNFAGYGVNGFRPVSRHSDTTAVIRNTKKEFPVPTWTDGNTGFTITKTQTGGDYGINVLKPFNATSNPDDTVVSFLKNSQFIIKNKVVGVVTDVTNGDMPAPFSATVITQGTVALAEISQISYDGIADVSTLASKHWTFNTVSTAYYVWHKVDGVGTDPAVALRTGILVEFDTTIQPGPARVVSEAIVALEGTTLHEIVFAAASTLTAGDYFNIYNDGEYFTPYYVIDDVGDDPEESGAIPLPIKINSTDDPLEVMNKSVKEIKAIYFNVPNPQGMGLRFTDYTALIDNDPNGRYDRGDGVVNNYPGTTQRDMSRIHKHKILVTTHGINGSGKDLDNQTDDFGKRTSAVGGNETRMVNFNINLFVKL